MSGSKKTFFSLFFFGEKRTKNALTAKTRSVSFLDCTRTLAVTKEFVYDASRCVIIFHHFVKNYCLIIFLKENYSNELIYSQLNTLGVAVKNKFHYDENLFERSRQAE